MILRLFFLALLGFSGTLQASSLKVEKISKSGKVLARSSETNIVPGLLYTAGEDCYLEVSQVRKQSVILNSDICQNSSRLRRGARLQLFTEPLEKTLNSQKTTISRSTLWRRGRHSSRGLRLGLIRGLQEFKQVIVPSNGVARTIRVNNADQNYGLEISYAHIAIGKLGYLPRLIYNQYSGDLSSWRLELNGTYGFSHRWYAIAGLSALEYNGNQDQLITQTGTGLGFQGGIGFQINKTFGLLLSYSNITNEDALDRFNQTVDFTTRGFELGLNATF